MGTNNVRRTPSYLKGLAETRARAAGDVERLGRLHTEVTARLETAQAELAACDRLIQKFDARLNPGLIAAIRSNGRCGRRGEMKQAICDYLQSSAPLDVPTTEITLILEQRFSLDFILPVERDAWAHGSVGKQLRRLAAEGLVERLHDPTVNAGTSGRWRWIGKSEHTLDALRQQAQAAGIGVCEVVDDPEAETQEGAAS